MNPDTTPVASPAAREGVPFGISATALPLGYSPSEVADELAFLPEEIEGLPRRQISHDNRGATAIYAIDQGVPVPRFGMIVAVKRDPSPDAAAVVATLQRERWGDPKDHDLTGSGPGDGMEPAFVLFSRSFPPGLFMLPYRPVFFLIWYRAGDDYAFMVIGDNPAVRAGLARAVAGTLTGLANSR